MFFLLSLFTTTTCTTRFTIVTTTTTTTTISIAVAAVSLSIVIRLLAGGSVSSKGSYFSSPRRAARRCSTSRLSHIQRPLVSFSSGVERPACETNHLPPSTAKIKNVWTCREAMSLIVVQNRTDKFAALLLCHTSTAAVVVVVVVHYFIYLLLFSK